MKKNRFLFLLGCLLLSNPLVAMKRSRDEDDGGGDRGKKRRKLWNRDGKRLVRISKEKAKKKKAPKKKDKRRRNEGRRCLETKCAICREDFESDTEVGIFRCGHAFCRGCIADLIHRGEPLCPTCRVKINILNIGAEEIEYGLYQDRKPIDGEREEAEKERAKVSREMERTEPQNKTPDSPVSFVPQAPIINSHFILECSSCGKDYENCGDLFNHYHWFPNCRP